jgi:hypothetical protein
MWAFGYSSETAVDVWDDIPLDADIVVTHTPPKYHLDERKDRRSVGCAALRHTLWRVRPKLVVCGHVHESRGVERVCWDLSESNIKYKEAGVQSWMDPGKENKKLSLVDLTTKTGNRLDNDGSIGEWSAMQRASVLERIARSPTKISTSVAPDSLPVGIASSHSLSSEIRGQGGTPSSKRCDLEALDGRMGRKETCIVNAAMMASSYPHGVGGKKYNKPIVVDVDLRVWDDNFE